MRGRAASRVLRARRALLVLGAMAVTLVGVVPSALAEDGPSMSTGAAAEGVATVHAGTGFSMAVKSDGTLWAWGDNADRQLGDGTTTRHPAPTKVTSLPARVRSVAIRNTSVVALLTDGSVWVWGNNAKGQLGTGTTTNVAAPTKVPVLTGARSVAIGEDFGIATMGNGSVFTWGDNTYGQLGDGTSVTSRTTPTAVGALGGARSVAAGDQHGLALMANGSVVAWGNNSSGQLGRTPTGGPNRTPTTVPGLTAVRSIAAGGRHSLALQGNGIVAAWGDNAYGQLGVTGAPTSPVQVTGPGRVRAVSASQDDSGSIGADGTVRIWGRNQAGQLGQGTNAPVTGTPFVLALDGARSLALGSQHGLAVTSVGKVMAWGDGTLGQLGTGDLTSHSTPVVDQMDLGDGYLEVRSGTNSTVALRADGTVWTWGINSSGQVPDGSAPTNHESPVKIPELTGARSIAIGGYHGMAILADGEVWGWGHNAYGQLGAGDMTNAVLPRHITQLDGALAVFLGGSHTAVIAQDGTVSMFGSNQHGELCTPGPDSQWTPQPRGQFAAARTIALGEWNTAVQLGDGSVRVCGQNTAGQLGVAALVDLTIDTDVPELLHARSISLGYKHGLAVLVNGGLATTGSNVDGNLGMTGPDRARFQQISIPGSPVQVSAGYWGSSVLLSDGTVYTWGRDPVGVTSTPTQVAGVADVRSVDIGSKFVEAVTASGVLLGWGANDNGQLGDGTFTALRPTPVEPNALPAAPVGLGQFRTSGGAAIAQGAWVSASSVAIEFTVADADGSELLTPYVEVRADGAPFASTCGAAGTVAGPGVTVAGRTDTATARVTVPVSNSSDNRWRACVVDAGGLASPWVAYGGTPDLKVDSLAPSPVSGLVTTATATAGSPVLSWNAASDSGSGIAGYQISRGTVTTGCTGSVVLVSVVGTSFSDASAIGGVTYCYSVRSIDTATNVATSASSVVSIARVSCVGLQTVAGSVTVSESGATSATYTLQLTAQPKATVSLGVSGDTDVTATVSPSSFSTSSWNTPHTVTVTAVNDQMHEGAAPAVVTHALSSSGGVDTFCPGTTTASVTVLDDDVAGILTSPGAAAHVAATEGGATGVYSIKLASQPIAPVTVAFATGSQIDPIASLVFDSATWNTPRQVTVTATADHVDEPTAHSGAIDHSVTSADADYDGMVLAQRIVDITDVDTAGFALVGHDSIAVNEAGATADTFTIALTSKPTASVTLSPVGDGQVTTSPSSITFAPAQWNVPQQVTVRAVDDPDDEPATHTGLIGWSVAPGGDPNYAGGPSALTASISDNDVAGIIVDAGAGAPPIAVGESGSTASYRLRLSSRPSDDVDVAFSPDPGLAPIAAVRFTPSDWSTWKTVAVVAVDDAIDEPGGASIARSIAHGVSSSDAVYAAMTVSPMPVTVADDDVAGVEITPASSSALQVGEGGATATYQVRLTSQPIAPVGIGIDGGSRLAPLGSLSFTASTWNTWQTVTVAALDDAVDQPVDTEMVAVVHAVASPDPAYDNRPVSDRPVAVADDDGAGIVVDLPASQNVTESGTTSTYRMRLASQPTANVVVTSDVTGRLTPIAPTTFTSTSWNVWQDVVVAVADDFSDEPASADLATITHAVVSSDPVYAAQSVDDWAITVIDDDVAGFELSTPSSTALVVGESGTTATYDVRLTSQPAADVQVSFVAGGRLDAVAPVTFTAADWNVWRTVTVAVSDDDVDEPASADVATLAHVVTSGDADYDGRALATRAVTVVDDDVAAVEIDPTATPTPSVVEGGATATYRVRLGSRPVSDVQVVFHAGARLQSIPTETFTAADWNVWRTVTVAAVDDAVDQAGAATNDLVVHDVVSADPTYGGRSIPDQAALVVDDDVASVQVDPMATPVPNLPEAGGTATYRLRLTSQPSSDVRIDVLSSGQLVPMPAVTFTAADWSGWKTVTVAVVDDAIDQPGAATLQTIQHVVTSLDSGYDGQLVSDQQVDVIDDDVASVEIDPIGGSTPTVGEAGATSSYRLRLTSEPRNDVRIDVHPGARLAAVPSITFTTADWNVWRTVTVAAVDDAVDQPGPAAPDVVAHDVVSLDPAYAGRAIPDQTVLVADDDTAAVEVDLGVTGVLVTSEAGATATYRVRLASEPAADVRLDLATDAQLTGLAPLTFTPATWSTWQSVTVAASDDVDAESPVHGGVVTTTAWSLDPAYDSMSLPTLAVQIVENDTAGLELDAIGGDPATMVEGGAAGQYRLRLTSRPTSDVAVSFDPGARFDPIAPITFTTGDWSAWQTVTLRTVDDDVAEPTGASDLAVQHQVATADAMYSTVVVAPRQVHLVDDDVAGITVDVIDGVRVSEAVAGAVDTVELVLRSQPVAPVTVSVGTDGQVLAGTGTASGQVVFTSADWDVPHVVSISAVDDHVDEDDPWPSVLTWTVASPDPVYDGRPLPPTSVQVADDDAAGLHVTRTSATTSLVEGASADELVIVLGSRPTSNVVVTATGGADLALDAVQLVFTPDTWSTPQHLHVGARDDLQAQPDRASTLTLAIASADPRYAALPSTVSQYVVADDPADRAIRTVDPAVVAPATPAPTGTTPTPAEPKPDPPRPSTSKPATVKPTPTAPVDDTPARTTDGATVPASPPATPTAGGDSPAPTSPVAPAPSPAVAAPLTPTPPVEDTGTAAPPTTVPEDDAPSTGGEGDTDSAHAAADRSDESRSGGGSIGARLANTHVGRWAERHHVAASVAASGAGTVAVAVGAKALGAIGGHALPGMGHIGPDWTDLLRKLRQARQLRKLKQSQRPSLPRRLLRELRERLRRRGEDGDEDPDLDDVDDASWRDAA